jgi:aurora kinase, other
LFDKIKSSKILNGFEFGPILGKGKFGMVNLAKHLDVGFIAAIKMIDKSKIKEFNLVNQLAKEIRLHSSLDHPNIVKFYGFFE